MENFSNQFCKDFPPLKNDRILKVANKEWPDKIPVWMLDPSLKYTKTQKEMDRELENFNICRKAENICQFTLSPLMKFDVDAVVIYSQMLAIPDALGLTVVKEGSDFVLETPLTCGAIKTLHEKGAIHRLLYVGEAINMTRIMLGGEVPLIGFTVAPLTVMSLMIECGHLESLVETRRWLREHINETHQVLTMLTNLIINFLVMQVDAGAQMLYVFENCESFSPQLFENFCAPYLKHISSTVLSVLGERKIGKVPMILFIKGGNYVLEQQKALEYDILTIDSNTSPRFVRDILGPHTILQGNLHPSALCVKGQNLKRVTRQMIRDFGVYNYIATVSGEPLDDADRTNITKFIKAVHGYKSLI